MNTYAQAAEILGVSRQRVYQMVSLATSLPQEITDFMLNNQDPALGRSLTERRLRPLTAIAGEDEQLALFRQMLTYAGTRGTAPCKASPGDGSGRSGRQTPDTDSESQYLSSHHRA